MPVFQYVFLWSLTSLSFFGSKAFLSSVNDKLKMRKLFTLVNYHKCLCSGIIVYMISNYFSLNHVLYYFVVSLCY